MASTAKTKTTTPELADEPELPEPSEAELAHDAELEAEALLADMPELKPPHKLRLREKNRLLALVLRSRAFNEEADDLDDVESKIAILELMGGIDEFAESIALDTDAYVEWAEGKNYPTFLAVMNRYSVALGE